MIVTRRALSRRTVLRGIGAAISLPFLDAMTPAFARTVFAAERPVRVAWVYVPNGIDMRAWTPAEEGALGTLPEILAPLEGMKSDLLVLSNLTTNWGRPLLDGGGDHARALASYLTGARVVKTAADIELGISADQVAANAMGHKTRLPSLEVGLEEARVAGSCDSGYSCAYSHNLAWKTNKQPLPALSNPRALFERLFGSDIVEPPAARARRMAMRQSILDDVLADTARLQTALGGIRSSKAGRYLTSVRDIERQLDRASKESMVNPEMDKPFGVPALFPDYFRLMTDMMVMAFKADLTRIATLMVGSEGSTRAYPEVGVGDGHHPLSHHRGNPEMLAKIRTINVFHATLFAEFVQKLKNTPEGDSNLLDNSLICYGSGLSDGNQHTHDQLPTVLVGRGGGAITPGRHIIYQRETPVTNLFGSMIEQLGVDAEHLGDSSGRLDGLSLT